MKYAYASIYAIAVIGSELSWFMLCAITVVLYSCCVNNYITIQLLCCGSPVLLL